MPGTTNNRDYASILDQFQTRGPLPAHAREERMQAVIDALWKATGTRGVSWIGIYTKAAGRDELILGPRRDKPACSPLSLKGVCGRCWLERRPILVADVATLGANYIACDPLDKSEVAVPLLERDGTCWGVLDADSYETGSFGTADVVGLTTLMEHAGLCAEQPGAAEILRL